MSAWLGNPLLGQASLRPSWKDGQAPSGTHTNTYPSKATRTTDNGHIKKVTEIHFSRTNSSRDRQQRQGHQHKRSNQQHRNPADHTELDQATTSEFWTWPELEAPPDLQHYFQCGTKETSLINKGIIPSGVLAKFKLV